MFGSGGVYKCSDDCGEEFANGVSQWSSKWPPKVNALDIVATSMRLKLLTRLRKLRTHSISQT